MMREPILSWHTREGGVKKKTGSWFWAIGIMGGGIAAASIIIGNMLLGIFAVIASVAVMLAGVRRPTTQVCSLSDAGIRVGGSFFPYSTITSFAIREGEPRRLVFQTPGFMGTISVSLEGVDFRTVQTEFKNHNVEEVDTLGSFGEKIAEWIGM